MADHVFEIACRVVEKGDLLYWDFRGDGKIDHTTVISSVDGELKYTAHTVDVFNQSVRETYKAHLKSGKKTKLHIVRLKKEAPKHKEPGLSDKIWDMAMYYSERALKKPLEWIEKFIAEE